MKLQNVLERPWGRHETERLRRGALDLVVAPEDAVPKLPKRLPALANNLLVIRLSTPHQKALISLRVARVGTRGQGAHLEEHRERLPTDRAARDPAPVRILSRLALDDSPRGSTEVRVPRRGVDKVRRRGQPAGREQLERLARLERDAVLPAAPLLISLSFFLDN